MRQHDIMCVEHRYVCCIYSMRYMVVPESAYTPVHGEELHLHETF